jgi:hypothetical protein
MAAEGQEVERFTERQQRRDELMHIAADAGGGRVERAAVDAHAQD